MSLHEWRSTALGAYLRFQKGVSYKGEYLDKPGLRLLGLGTIVPGGGISLAAARQYCGPVKPHQQIQPGEVYVALTDITQDGRVLGSPALLPSNARGRYAVTHHVAKAIIERPEGLDMTFLYYLLQSEPARAYFRGVATGTTVRAVSAQDAENLAIQLPPLSEQREIASILGALDDKIELNRRMNATLEAMARALFQSWFVDFDPVRAKAEGRQPVGMDAETAALFPDSFEDSALGPIPTGWRTAAVKDIGDVVTGKTPSTADARNFGDDVPFITIPDMHDKVFATSTARKLSAFGAQTQPNKSLPAGTLCVSCIATTGLVVITTEIAQTNQQINAVLPNSREETYYWFWVLKNLGAEIASHGSGGSVLSNLSKTRFERLRVVKAPTRLMQEYSKIVKPSFEKIRAVALERENIAATRDTILPKLLSGELRVGGVAA